MSLTSAHPAEGTRNYPPGAVTYMLFAADKGDINTIIGGIAPDWGPFGSLGNEAKVMIEVVMTPVTYAIVGWLKRHEHEDYYDTDTNFTPFSLKD